MQISVMLGNLRQPFLEALDTVQELGIPAVQLSVGSEDDAARRREMLQEVQKRGLTVSAICVNLGDLGEVDKAAEHVEALKPLLEAAVEIGGGICQTHIGIIPHTTQGPRWESFVRSAAAIAEDACRIGGCLAMETGPEPPAVVEKLVRTIDSPGLRVNYDPANFILWPHILATYPQYGELTEAGPQPFDREFTMSHWEPVEGVKRLGPYIAHTHAKDAIGGENAADVELGHGWVDWPRYLRLLKEAGFDGYLAIEREAGEDRVGDVRRAAEFLRQQLRAIES